MLQLLLYNFQNQDNKNTYTRAHQHQRKTFLTRRPRRSDAERRRVSHTQRRVTASRRDKPTPSRWRRKRARRAISQKGGPSALLFQSSVREIAKVYDQAEEKTNKQLGCNENIPRLSLISCLFFFCIIFFCKAKYVYLYL